MFEGADWNAMVQKAVAWLLANPGEGTIHVLPAIVETPLERAFYDDLLMHQDELRAFQVEVMRVLWAKQGEVW